MKQNFNEINYSWDWSENEWANLDHLVSGNHYHTWPETNPFNQSGHAHSSIFVILNGKSNQIPFQQVEHNFVLFFLFRLFRLPESYCTSICIVWGDKNRATSCENYYYFYLTEFQKFTSVTLGRFEFDDDISFMSSLCGHWCEFQCETNMYAYNVSNTYKSSKGHAYSKSWQNWPTIG